MQADDAEVPAAMKRVHRRLQRWRSKRKGRSRIPESLWIAAGELAREHGVNPVSRVLGLEFNHLRQMAEVAGSTRRKRGQPTPPAFVELLASPKTVAPQFAIELEGRRGKLRIEWRGTTTELASFSRALWEMVS